MARSYNDMADFNTALQNAYTGMPKAIETALRSNIGLLIDNIRLRVSDTGKNATGGAFSTPYSRSHAYKRKKDGKGAKGQQTSYKGFFYQGTMWENFKLLSAKASALRVTATLGFAGDNKYLTNDRLNEIHSQNEGIAIAMPNKDESIDITRKIGFAIGEYLNNAL